MYRTPARRRMSTNPLEIRPTRRRNSLKPNSIAIDTDDDVIIENFSSDEDIPIFPSPLRTGSLKRTRKVTMNSPLKFRLDDRYLIEDVSPFKESPDKRERIECFVSPKRPRGNFHRSLISSFPSPRKTPQSTLRLAFHHRTNFGPKLKTTTAFDMTEDEDPPIIESFDEIPSSHYSLEERECTISTTFSPVKIDFTSAAFKKDQSSFANNRKSPKLRLRRTDGNAGTATPSTCTQSSLVVSSDFVKTLYKQMKNDSRQLEYERLKFNKMSDVDKSKQKCLSLQILTMNTDPNLSVIDGEIVDLTGFDGTDSDETDLQTKKIRIILPRQWSEGMGLSKLTVIQLFYPLKVTRTNDERILLDNIFWIQVEERGKHGQILREPLEHALHRWDCLCQSSIERPIPVCNAAECSSRFSTAQELKRLKA